MPDDLTAYEERVRARAHQLWLHAGTPQGRDEEFWHQAEAELAQEGSSEAAVTPPPQKR